MARKLNRLDLNIIDQLHKDGRISLTELAKKVNSSRPTVTNRLKRLIDEEIVIIRGGLNIRKFGYKVANVGIEVKSDEARKRLLDYLNKCPRVLEIFRSHEKANIVLRVWGENDQTIASTIESFGDLPNVNIVYTNYLGTPIQGSITINTEVDKKEEATCGKLCATCERYINTWCLGCPGTTFYKDPLLEVKKSARAPRPLIAVKNTNPR